MDKRSFKSEEEKRRLRAIYAQKIIRKKQGLPKNPSKKELRTAAKKQQVTQKFLKEMGERGEIAHPNKLKKGDDVFRIRINPHTKTVGTVGEGWVKGKVKTKGTVGQQSAVKVKWEDKDKVQIYTAEGFEAASVVQTVKHRGVGKSERAMAAEKIIKEKQKQQKRKDTATLRSLVREFQHLGKIGPIKRKQRLGSL